jgi:hypothetical protein
MSTASVRVVLFDIAPEFYTVDVTELARIDRFIVRAQQSVNSNLWGDKNDEAVALLTAHSLTMALASTSKLGVVKREKTSMGEIEYQGGEGTSGVKGLYSGTSYGRQFSMLASTIKAGPRLLNRAGGVA